MAIRNDILGGTDYTEEGLKPSDQNDTNNAIIQGITQVSIDQALTAGSTNTLTLPTNRDWTKVKMVIECTNTSGSAQVSIDSLRVNGNSGASDYQFTRNAKDTTTVQAVTGSEIGCASTTHFADIDPNGEQICFLELDLINDKVIYRGETTDYTVTDRWCTNTGIMTTSETSIASISFDVDSNITGRVKVWGEVSE